MCLKFQAKIEEDFADVEKSEKHCYLWRIELLFLKYPLDASGVL